MHRRSHKERVCLLANGEQGVFSRCPHTIHKERQKAAYNIKLLQIKSVFNFLRFLFFSGAFMQLLFLPVLFAVLVWLLLISACTVVLFPFDRCYVFDKC
jgi:hypothetical protein